MTPQEKIDRADEASRLLESPVLAEALELMKQSVVNEFETVSLRDTEGVFILHHKLKTVQHFKNALMSIVDRGQAALPEWERNQGLHKSGPVKRAFQRAI